jgi:shikimate dehydrogenase
MDQYAVIGNPIKHSLSPLIHALFAKQTQQLLQYHAIQAPLDGLPQVLDHFQKSNGKGVNITSPFKQQAFDLVDYHTDRALRAKSINTIRFNEDGTRLGDNTDGIGFLKDLCSHHQFVMAHKRILILGAGGAVRGILGPLLEQKPSLVMIANRTIDKALQLVNEFSSLGNVQATCLQDLVNVDYFDLIIHAASLGLAGEKLILPETIFTSNTFCYDLAYSQVMTPFLNWAKRSGVIQLSDGLGMLIEQAAEAFYLWRNIRPSTNKLREVIKNEHST